MTAESWPVIPNRLSEPMGEVVPPIPERNEATMAAALKPFGWTCEPAFWQRYYSDAWVFNLANAVEVLTERVTELSLALSERSSA